MDSISVKVDDLLQMAQELKSAGMDYVTLTLSEADDEFPELVSFEAWTKAAPYEGVDFEEIYAVSE